MRCFKSSQVILTPSPEFKTVNSPKKRGSIFSPLKKQNKTKNFPKPTLNCNHVFYLP